MQIQWGDVLANLIAVALVVGVIVYVIRGFWKRLDHLRDHEKKEPTGGLFKDHTSATTGPTDIKFGQRKVKVFLCYRRADSSDVTGRIYDRLIAELGREAVFKDVDDIPHGVDFRAHVETAISQTNVFLAVIGPLWRALDMSNGGHSRLDAPRDHVRIEVSFALAQGIPLIPVLVGGATMPTEQEVPEDMKPLIYRNAAQIRPDPDFHNDIDRLLKGIRMSPFKDNS